MNKSSFLLLINTPEIEINSLEDDIVKITLSDVKRIPAKDANRGIDLASDVILAAVITGGVSMLIEIIKLIFSKKEKPEITVIINNDINYSINQINHLSKIDKSIEIKKCEIKLEKNV